MTNTDVVLYIAASIVALLTFMFLFKYVLGLHTMLKNQQAIIKILCEIAERNGVSTDKLDGIKNEVNSNN